MQEKILNAIKILFAFILMTIMGTIALVLRIISFGALTNFNREYFVPAFCKIILFSIGIKVENNLNLIQPKTPHFYTFNHDSFLDGFVLMSLGLTNARFLLSEKMLIYIPATITSIAIGVLYIPTKKNRARRLEYFINLEKRIKKEKTSIVGSSEGVHDYKQNISEFNRGVYHMALVCDMPVVAMFIYTPSESNPYNYFRPFKSGTVKVELLKIIPTQNWTLENLDMYIADIRNLYVAKFNELHNASTT